MLKILDLFAGAGGLSLGFEKTGQFEVAAIVENNKNAAKTYLRNHPGLKNYEDILTVDFQQIKKGCGEIDVIIGGPPCQDFSNAGNRTEGERAELTHSFAKIITAVKPKFFVMENVARASESEAYKKARKLFIDNRYGLTEIVLDASHCNVPQKRNRVNAFITAAIIHNRHGQRLF